MTALRFSQRMVIIKHTLDFGSSEHNPVILYNSCVRLGSSNSQNFGACRA